MRTKLAKHPLSLFHNGQVSPATPEVPVYQSAAAFPLLPSLAAGQNTLQRAPSRQYGQYPFIWLTSCSMSDGLDLLISPGGAYHDCVSSHRHGRYFFSFGHPLMTTLQKVDLFHLTGCSVLFQCPNQSRQRDNESALTPQSEAVRWYSPITDFIIHFSHFQHSVSY